MSNTGEDGRRARGESRIISGMKSLPHSPGVGLGGISGRVWPHFAYTECSVQCNAVQYSALQNSAVQSSAVHNSAVKFSVVQCSATFHVYPSGEVRQVWRKGETSGGAMTVFP